MLMVLALSHSPITEKSIFSIIRANRRDDYTTYHVHKNIVLYDRLPNGTFQLGVFQRSAKIAAVGLRTWPAWSVTTLEY